jgi:hypothetical protein
LQQGIGLESGCFVQAEQAQLKLDMIATSLFYCSFEIPDTIKDEFTDESPA